MAARKEMKMWPIGFLHVSQNCKHRQNCEHRHHLVIQVVYSLLIRIEHLMKNLSVEAEVEERRQFLSEMQEVVSSAS